MSDVLPEEKPGLYIHVPFCKTKCPYCDFFSTTDLGRIASWLEALVREMDAYGDVFSGFDSVYLGGGTPSVLDDRTIRRVLASVADHWSLTPGTEVTLEANPDDVTQEKLLLYQSLGINRLSIGVQSFDEEGLTFLGRRHTAKGALRALELVRSCDFDNFGIDLMYGLKAQTREKWLSTLEVGLGFRPAHLSCYQLTVESRTPFGRLSEEGRLEPLGDEAGRGFFLDTSRLLQDRGFLHYEISNFAKTQSRVSRHNSKYWSRAPYLGLGPGAHSFQNGKRWWNTRSLERYCETLGQGLKPAEGFEVLTPEQVRLEKLYFAFRTREGISYSDLGPRNVTSKTFADLKRLGLIEVRGTRITPTTAGFLLADRLPLMFPD